MAKEINTKLGLVLDQSVQSEIPNLDQQNQGVRRVVKDLATDNQQPNTYNTEQLIPNHGDWGI